MGFALDAYGEHKQGKEASKTGKINARLLEAQAGDALLRGANEESQYRRHIAQMLGTQKAEIGRRNVARSGTALDMLEDTAQIGEEDIVNIRNNAAREAWGLRHGAKESRRQGKAAKKQANLAAVSSLINSGTKAFGSWGGG